MTAFDLPTHRPFSRAEARDLGVSAASLRQLVLTGRLLRPVRGVYRSADCPDTLTNRCAALRLVAPSDAFVVDRTAAWLHRGDDALAPNEDLVTPPVSFFRRPGHHRLRNGLAASGERDVRDSDLVEIEGLTVTTPLRTALDLGRLGPSRDLRLWGIDCMLGLGVFDLEELLEQVERFRGERGVVGLRLLAPYGDRGAASFGESSSRLRWLDAGLPRPTTQIPELGPHGEVAIDMGLEEERFGTEFEGEAFHGPAQERHDTERRDYLRDVRLWTLPILRGINVWGRAQNADVLLRHAWAAHRSTRRHFL